MGFPVITRYINPETDLLPKLSNINSQIIGNLY
jgi:hypothetical protein